ncbi:hypothetical protein Moror_2106 [Moniliophthora roreri MCA 2997]|uniref:Transmembrane protein n=1 Tax=Moniliophthora roreri (strain MCA 2997) TaxID=1381753 RepID=V2WT59_MONRO|nr:hypothetical protein Moror_2106 [Moniliophthora roreri MCA 2997]
MARFLSFTRFPRRVVIDDTDPRVKYETQSWSLDAAGSFNNISAWGPAYNNTMHGSSQNSASFSFNFEGEYVSVWGAKDNRKIPKDESTDDDLAKLARWQCQVDGSLIESFNYPRDIDFITNNVLCETSGLSLTAPHVLTVNITVEDPETQMFWFDKIEYAPGPNVKLAGEVMKFDSSDSSIRYNNGSGSWVLDTSAGIPLFNATRTTGASMSFRFNGQHFNSHHIVYSAYTSSVGTQVTLHGVDEGRSRSNLRAESSGRYHIDGIDDQTFLLPGSRPFPSDSSIPTNHWNEWLFTSPELEPGTHELLVTFMGVQTGGLRPQGLSVDYFYVAVAEIPTNGSDGKDGSRGLGPENHPGSKDKPVGGIVGGTVCGVITIFVLGWVICFYYRRRKLKTEIFTSVPYDSQGQDILPVSFKAAPNRWHVKSRETQNRGRDQGATVPVSVSGLSAHEGRPNLLGVNDDGEQYVDSGWRPQHSGQGLPPTYRDATRSI